MVPLEWSRGQCQPSALIVGHARLEQFRVFLEIAPSLVRDGERSVDDVTARSSDENAIGSRAEEEDSTASECESCRGLNVHL